MNKLMTNREIAELVFEIIRSYGFKPYDIQYGNGYFIFDRGVDSVVHFRVKGVSKHWKFGMWVNAEYLDEEERKRILKEYPDEEKNFKVLQLFAQYDTCIDKFKPSCSELLIEEKYSDWHWVVENKSIFELDTMLKMMKRHPLMCYVGQCGDHAGYYDGSFLKTFIENESYDKMKKFEKAVKRGFWAPYTKIKCDIARKDKCISELSFVDFEKKNPSWSTSYLYEVNVKFTEAATDEEEVNWLNKWFKKDKYGKFDAFDHVVELQLLTKEGREGCYSYGR